MHYRRGPGSLQGVHDGSGDVGSGFDGLVGSQVVMDTAGPVVYLGKLTAYDEGGFWLEEADLHNATEGHASREAYIAGSHRGGIEVNRRRIYVLRHAVISVSALPDVVAE